MRDKMTGPNTAKSGFIYRYNGSRSYNYTIKAGIIFIIENNKEKECLFLKILDDLSDIEFQ
jgi:hypothetical protein